MANYKLVPCLTEQASCSRLIFFTLIVNTQARFFTEITIRLAKAYYTEN